MKQKASKKALKKVYVANSEEYRRIVVNFKINDVVRYHNKKKGKNKAFPPKKHSQKD